ncbi:NIN-like protein [Artemisia annua]|uniref:NIN-like protein n=1 Tax=Artemisia annua TaxID=35608 RepID=A0A2U1L0K1_ARTAN|nr:NIN-like protein [Artemisia annua]
MALQNDDEMLCSFLECFPTYRLHSKPQSENDDEMLLLWVFSSKDEEGSESNSCSYSDDVRTRMTIHDMVISAFSKVETNIDCIIQLWAPVTIGGIPLLSTSAQPFALRYFGNHSENYWRRCQKYGYNIDVSNKSIIDDNEHNSLPEIISSGPPLSAFLNCLPEMLTLKTSVHQEAGPLLGYGSEECEWRTFWMMPIFDPSRSSSFPDCIGVIECSYTEGYDGVVFDEMNDALKTISRLKPTKEQIQEALETICESHDICLAQVWISSEDNNHEHFSSSLMGTQMKQMLALKLTGYTSIDEQSLDIFWELKEYYDTCDKIPLKKGGELVLKTFQDYKPRFYKDNSKLGTDILLTELTDDIKSSGLTICMRSIDTSDFDYAFEFIWCHNSNYVMLLEALLLTLKRCLPRFKCASGAELGDELHVIDVDNSTKSETKTFKIFQQNRLFPTPEEMEKGKNAMIVGHRANTEVNCKTAKITLPREVIEQQFGNTMKEAAENLQVSLSTLKRKLKGYGITEWQGPDLSKRKVNDSFNNQNCTNEKDYGTIQDPLSINRDKNTLTIKAGYADDTIKFDLPISEATFYTIEKEIGARFELRLGTYRLKYRDGGDWISLLSNKDMIYYMETLRRLGQTEARLSVFIRKQ